MRTIAVVLAGGTGTRMGSELPKQLLDLDGRPVLAHALAAFDGHPEVDEVLLVMAPGHLDAARAVLAAEGFTKVTSVVEGGASRAESTLRALDALPDDDCRLLLHDAARPLVSARLVSDCIRALDRWDAATAVVACADTIVGVDDAGTITATPARASLRRVQTPQAFRSSTLRAAYARAVDEPGFEATDDCGVVRRHLPDVAVGTVPGDEENLKVTTPSDLVVVRALLDARRS